MIQQIGDLIIEATEDGVSLYGALDITRDWKGLDVIRELKTAVDRIALTLEREAADGTLPEVLPAPENIDEVPNPFKEK